MTAAEHRAIRLRLGLTLGALARLEGVGRRTLERWEAGDQAVSAAGERILRLLEASHERGAVDVLAELREMASSPTHLPKSH